MALRTIISFSPLLLLAPSSPLFLLRFPLLNETNQLPSAEAANKAPPQHVPHLSHFTRVSGTPFFALPPSPILANNNTQNNNTRALPPPFILHTLLHTHTIDARIDYRDQRSFLSPSLFQVSVSVSITQAAGGRQQDLSLSTPPLSYQTLIACLCPMLFSSSGRSSALAPRAICLPPSFSRRSVSPFSLRVFRHPSAKSDPAVCLPCTAPAAV